MDSDFYPELVELAIDEAFVRDLLLLIGGARRFVSWQAFSRISAEWCQGPPRQVISDVCAALAGRYSYLTPSPAQPLMLCGLKACRPRAANLLFRFLCLNEAIELKALERVVGQEHLARLRSRSLLLRRSDAVRLAVTAIPYGDHFYIAESRHLLQHRSRYSVVPAQVSDQAHLQVVYLRRLLGRSRPGRILEMGCGVGLVSLELQAVCRHREGAELCQRSLDFAVANARIRGDRDIRFYRSDLFSHVEGKFDAIVFNPWQPTSRHLGLLTRFIEQAPEYLTEDGRVVCLVGSDPASDADGFLKELTDVLERRSLVATEHVAKSWSSVSRDGKRVTQLLSFLLIERRRTPGPTLVRRKVSTQAGMYIARDRLNAILNAGRSAGVGSERLKRG